MPVTVGKLAGDVEDMVLPVGDDPEDVVNIKYRPGALTLDVADRLKTLGENEQIEVAAILLLPLLVEWDILNDDGTPLPLTREGLGKVPLVFLNRIADEMTNASRPSRDEGKGSPATSPQADERVSSLTGT
jgi:hypothetical protein